MPAVRTFKEIASEIPEVCDCFREGLQALGSNAGVVKVKNTRELNGSIDLDVCSNIPTSGFFTKRWDYLFDYQQHVLALEVHPAHGDRNIMEVVEKAAWLKNWLRKDGLGLVVKGFYFVSTGPVSYSNSSIRGKLAQKGISLCGKVLDVEKEMKLWK